jgi:hypothetical protein
MEKINIIEFIKTIRESFGGSIAVYTMGNCYQFYEILKVVFPSAVAYETGGHVYTKIGDNFYDIRGKLNEDYDLKLVTDDRIESLSKNKWIDERRIEYGKTLKDKYENNSR